MTLAMSASDIARHPFKMTRYAANNVKYNPESQKTMHAKKFFKITPTQEDIYNLLNSTEERPMSSTLSPYSPLPAIGNTFVGPAKNKRRTRLEERKHQVVMETVDLKRTKPKVVTRIEPKKKQNTIKKEKSLELGSNHGRHILNILGMKRKKKEEVLLQKAKTLGETESIDSSEDIEIKQGDNKFLSLTEIKTDEVLNEDASEVLGINETDNNKILNVREVETITSYESEKVDEATNGLDKIDDVVQISSDLSALHVNAESLETTRNHESEEFIHNCIKGVEKKSASIKSPFTPKKKNPFTLVRERTYDLLEPKILKSKQEEGEELGPEQSLTRMSGKRKNWSHKLSMEHFGPVSLEQSTGSIAFGRRLSSMEGDIDDFERPITSGSLSGQNEEDLFNNNDNPLDELQVWQLQNADKLDSDSSRNRPDTPLIGIVPRVLELKRSNLDSRPLASRFAKLADDQDLLVSRNKTINRLNSPLRLKSGVVSDSVRVLDITPLNLDCASVIGSRVNSGRPSGKIEDLRLQEVKTPYIAKADSFDKRVKTRSGTNRTKIMGFNANSVDEVDTSVYNLSFDSALKRRDSRFLDMKTPSIEEIGSFNGDFSRQISTDNDNNSQNWEIRTPPNIGDRLTNLRSYRESARAKRLINARTPSIEEIGSADSDLAVQRSKTRGSTQSRMGRGSAFGGGRTSAQKGKLWNLKTPSIEEIGTVEVTSSRRKGWDYARTPSIEEMETRDMDGSTAGDEEGTKKQKAYWIDL